MIWDELVSQSRPCSAAQIRALPSLCEVPVPPPALKTRQSWTRRGVSSTQKQPWSWTLYKISFCVAGPEGRPSFPLSLCSFPETPQCNTHTMSSLSGKTRYTVTQTTGSQMWALAPGQSSCKLGDMINKTAKGGLRSPHSSSLLRGTLFLAPSLPMTLRTKLFIFMYLNACVHVRRICACHGMHVKGKG